MLFVPATSSTLPTASPSIKLARVLGPLNQGATLISAIIGVLQGFTITIFRTIMVPTVIPALAKLLVVREDAALALRLAQDVIVCRRAVGHVLACAFIPTTSIGIIFLDPAVIVRV